MADIADLAGIQNEAAQAATLKVRKPEGPKATGFCLYCASGLPHGVRWCDSGCQQDWEVEQKAAERNGRVR